MFNIEITDNHVMWLSVFLFYKLPLTHICHFGTIYMYKL